MEFVRGLKNMVRYGLNCEIYRRERYIKNHHWMPMSFRCLMIIWGHSYVKSFGWN